MSPNILLNVRRNLEKASIINEKRIKILLNHIEKYWKKDKIVYPTQIKSLLYISYKQTYEILDIIKELGVLEYNFQVYCSECEKFQDFKILKSLNQFPEELYCEGNHRLSPLKDTVLIYKVIRDE